jgi:hypothetical protein
MFQHPSIAPGMQILKISRSSPANVPSAAKKKRYFRMNLIGSTLAAGAMNPLTLPLARLRVKAKVSHRASHSDLNMLPLNTKAKWTGFYESFT